MSVAAALEQAGLAHLVPKFEGLSFQSFKSLLIQDYEKHGVYNMADKQALFKVIKELSAEELSFTLSPENSAISQANSSPDPASRYNPKNKAMDNILDDDDDDDDLADDANDRILDLDDDDDNDFLAEDELEAEAFSQAFMRMNVAPTTFSNPSVHDDDGVSSAASAIHAGSHHSASHHSASHNNSSSHNNNNNRPLERLESTAASAAPDLDHNTNDTNSNTIVDTNSNSAAVLSPSMVDPPRIRVIVRKRPLSRREIDRGENDVLECDAANATLYVHEPKVKVDLTKYTECHSFSFDDVFDEHIDNDSVYIKAVRPLIATLFKSGKGTCFAYGQTGSGKTYTMQPLPLRAAVDIFNIISAVPEYSALSLHVACYEIYGGKVYDLLNGRQKLEVREDAKKKVQVVGLKEVEVKSVDVLLKLCEHAACARSTGSTGMNDESSRSHSIMTFALRAPSTATTTNGNTIMNNNTNRPMMSRMTMGGPPGSNKSAPTLRTIGKLSFIDLAGSERGADTYDNDKQTRLEGAEINKSLLALKECIRALDMQAIHIPFRGSKLTSVLRDSFIGKNARTVMIANVSPSSNSCEHTLNTLRYADRVKEIKKDNNNGNGNGGNTTNTTTTNILSATAMNTTNNTTINSSSHSHEIAMLLHTMPLPNVPVLGSNGNTPATAVQGSPRKTHGTTNGNNNSTMASPVRRPQQQRMSMAALKSSNGTTTVLQNNKNGTTTQASPHKTPINNKVGSSGGGGGGGNTTTINANTMMNNTSINAHPLEHAGSLSEASQSTATTPPSSSNNNTTTINNTTTPPIDPGLFAAEEELITCHRQHIENTMSIVKEEMELLAQLDNTHGTAMTIESYVEELSNVLIEKAASISALQQQVSAFRRQLRNGLK